MTDAAANATADTIPRQILCERLLLTAQRSGHFRHLTAPIKQAGLNDDCTGAGPYTLFAPHKKALDHLARDMLTDPPRPRAR